MSVLGIVGCILGIAVTIAVLLVVIAEGSDSSVNNEDMYR